MRPVIDLLRESAELDPRLTEACADGCDPVKDPGACLASQIRWALAHPEPVHVHAWQPGPVVEWRYQPGYNHEVHDPRPTYRVAERMIWWCPCGDVEQRRP